MPPKRILLTLEALDMSGAAFSAQNLVAGLNTQGVEVMLLSRESGVRECLFEQMGAKVFSHRHFGVPLLGRKALAMVKSFSPDIIHAQAVSVAGASIRLAQGVGCPVVVTANRLDAGDDGLLRSSKEAGIIAVSDAIQERLSNRNGIDRSRITVIPNGLDLSMFPTPSLEAREDHPHVPVIGSYGTLAERKGQRIFLQAAAKVAKTGLDAEFLIMGQGPDKPALRQLAEDLGITSRITFTPSTTTDARHLPGIDLFVEPTYEEGLGLSVLQAMATGVPVIASGVGGIYSIIKDGETGVLVPCGDAEALASAILELLKNPEKRFDLAVHARKRVEDKFSAKAVAARVLAYYESCIDGRVGSGEGE